MNFGRRGRLMDDCDDGKTLPPRFANSFLRRRDGGRLLPRKPIPSPCRHSGGWVLDRHALKGVGGGIPKGGTRERCQRKAIRPV